MGNVLIIKNNDVNNDIHKHAQDSYVNNVKRIYNVKKGTVNEECIKEIKEHFEGNGIIILISYGGVKGEDIKDIFIGEDANVNGKDNIEYVMKVHLTNEKNGRAIKSIIDKMDLDILKDFGEKRYIIMSDMDSLFQELKERIIAKSSIQYHDLCEKKERTNMDYQLSVLAQNDSHAIRIYSNAPIDENRTEFQRDRERIVNCKAFRRMVDKAQIFSAEKGDYYRTRMTHSLEVNQIAKAISYALNLNLDLTEAIALGHDLGHTPFGHQGERTLDSILCGKADVGIPSKKLLEQRCFGGFKHNYQSAKVLSELEEKYIDFPGLNVSVQVIEGVLKHTRIKPEEIVLEDFLPKEYIDKIYIDYEKENQVCSSLEGQVVAVADEIAQRGHDVDDALTSGVMSIEEFIDRLKISKCSELQAKIRNEIAKIDKSNRLIIDKKELKIARIVSSIINYFITTTIEHSQNIIEENKSLGNISLDNRIKMVEFSQDVERVNSYLERVVQKKVICNSEVARADYNADMIVKKLFEKYYANPRLLHSGTIHKIFVEMLHHRNPAVSNSAIHFSDCSVKLVNEEIKEITTGDIDEMLVIEGINRGRIDCDDKNFIIFEKRKILIRAITDYIAGMTDGYALEEFNKLK